MAKEAHRFSTKFPHICQCIPIVSGILDLNPQIILVALVLLRQVRRMLKVARLPAHAYCSLEVERQLVRLARAAPIALGFRLDEAVEP
jgi:hypothetical protein